MNNTRSCPMSAFGPEVDPALRHTGSVTHEFAEFVERTWTAIARAIKVRRTRYVLSGLDDHMLKDIGVSRSEIHAAALHSVEQPHIPYRKRA